MAQQLISREELIDSFFRALENGKSTEELDILAEEFREFNISESEIYEAQRIATESFCKNCW
jgi:hypothetical protein